LFLCFAIAGVAVGPRLQMTPEARQRTSAYLMLASLLDSLALALLVEKVNGKGWRLAALVFAVLFGVQTVLTQVETAFFLRTLPAEILLRIVIWGALSAALFSPLLVRIWGRWRFQPSSAPELAAPSFREGVRALAWTAPLYLAVYFLFGYYVAWKNPAVRAFYGGQDPGNFLRQMKSVVLNSPGLIVLQVARAALWTALTVAVLRVFRGSWNGAAWVIAFCFATLLNSPLLIPNPLMPDAVRLTHLVETAPSTFLFVLAVVYAVRRSAARRSISCAMR